MYREICLIQFQEKHAICGVILYFYKSTHTIIILKNGNISASSFSYFENNTSVKTNSQNGIHVNRSVMRSDLTLDNYYNRKQESPQLHGFI